MITFRPNYGNKPSVVSSNINPSSVEGLTPIAQPIFEKHKNLDFNSKHPDPKLITSRILNIKKNNPSINRYLSMINPDLHFNSYNWTTWFVEVSNLNLKFITQENKLRMMDTFGRFHLEIAPLMLDESQLSNLQKIQKLVLKPQECVLILKALTMIKFVVEPPKKLISLITKQAISNLDLLDDKELTILLITAKTLFSNEEKTVLLEKVLKVYPLERFNKVSFHARVSFLNTFSKLDIFKNDEKLSKLYTESSCNYLESTSEVDIDTLDVLTLLECISNLSQKKPNVKILERIENILANRLSFNSFELEIYHQGFVARAITSFSKVKYLPTKFLPHLKKALKDPSVLDWDKAVIFEALGKLSYTHIYLEFKRFIDEDLLKYHPKKNKQIWETIYPAELLSILRAVDFIYPKTEKLPKHIQGIANRIQESYVSLPVNTQLLHVDVCNQLGLNSN